MVALGAGGKAGSKDNDCWGGPWIMVAPGKVSVKPPANPSVNVKGELGSPAGAVKRIVAPSVGAASGTGRGTSGAAVACPTGTRVERVMVITELPKVKIDWKETVAAAASADWKISIASGPCSAKGATVGRGISGGTNGSPGGNVV